MVMMDASTLYYRKQIQSSGRTKIQKNKERDIKEQKELASMGWHCITVWECQLKPAFREQTLKSLEYTLNHIFLIDRSLK